MSKIINPEEAATLIEDGSTIGISIMGLAGWPEEIAKAVEERYLETGFPQELTVISSAGAGDGKERGVNRFAHEGLVKKWIAGHMGQVPQMRTLVEEDKIEGYNIPQGVIVQLWREISAKRPGLFTKVGIDTFVDPRIEGGKMNNVSNDNLVKVMEVEGEEYLFFKSYPVNVAIIRGSVADEKGNLTMDKEGIFLEALPLAQATKNCGGIVIAQVEHIAKTGTLHPKNIKVPGILIDYVVQCSNQENHWQTEGVYFNPSFSGDVKVPLSSIPSMPLNERKIAARRASMELTSGSVVNLGIGVSADVATVAGEEKASDLMDLTTESGTIGGVPASPPHFGHTYNPEAVIEHHAQFDYYDGGGISISFLGMAQIDKLGNINVTKFNGRVIGSGGFINISQNSQKVVFCGTFTAGRLEVAIEDGKIQIIKEGKVKKFVNHVEQITYSGNTAMKNNQPVLYVTERAVFTLDEQGLCLIEVAPGIELERDIFSQMEFRPNIASELKTMNPDIFYPDWNKLRSIILQKG